MALVWLPLDDRTIDGVVALAGSSWTRAELDDAWVAAGWPLPEGRSLAEEVYGAAEYRFDVDDHRWVSVAMRFDPDEVIGFFLAFATYLDEHDPEDEDVRELVSAGGAPWSADALATRAEFDARHDEAVARLTARLGEPHVVGTHDDEWHHAAWRVGDRLVVLAQGENFDRYGMADDACLWVVRHEPDQPLPTGDALYAFLCGDATPA
ncbi:hypothetical protein ADK67_29730 [Saccharothrix sp. NRRL B-16348]|uniref:hypothetical protein n=1 Tax=Saccharothrix sp. NRRL B-16348 TaxID=1415542 RepID=UPI0006AF534F|nr:hypothetical protein [Saccharothrix sp. NRRL B-16348]KOX20477.1 hypothetical protein ADK67_29730 [Saccharothrix sp. NRRL B-16348]